MNDPVRRSLCDLPLVEVASKIERMEISPVETLDAVLQRVSQVEPQLNAFITIMDDAARREAREAEAEIRAGHYRGPLHGIPLSVKDLFATAGVRTSGGSRLFADYVPDEDATVIARLKRAGAVIFGKNNMLELAYAAVHPDYVVTRNPWDLARSTSGSSTGSAAAVAAGMSYGSLGTDNAGSVRLPASYCGIVGLKPTYGRVSRHGVLPGSWTADHVGPMTRTVADAAAMLNAIAGYDPGDPTSSHEPVPDYLDLLRADFDLRGVRIGIDDAYLRQHVDAAITPAIEAALAHFQSLGARVEHVQLPPIDDIVAALLAIVTSEIATAHLHHLREQRKAYSQPVRERLELGLMTPAFVYLQAQRLRRQVIDAMLATLDKVDFLITPTTPTAATLLDQDVTTGDEADPALLAALIYFTCPFNLTGFPAISIPCGFSVRGLPVGLQIAGRPRDEQGLLQVAHAYEQTTLWHRALPLLLTSTDASLPQGAHGRTSIHVDN
jgi:aspartyl-tRNA(Asn)/glutamyl-tRNA(Gln) amidotransferase subunit A